MTNPNFQSPEFLRLFETYTASADSIGAKMTLSLIHI